MTRLFTRFGLDAGVDVGIQDGGYAWDDYDPYEVIRETDDISYESFQEIGAAGHILYSSACTELIIQMLYPLWPDDRLILYLDAVWSAILSEEYFVPDEFDTDNFEGPLQGMVALAFLNTINTWYGADEESSSLDAAFSYHCTQHVLGQSPDFRRWTKVAVSRLSQAVPDRPAPAEDGGEEDEEESEGIQPLPIELLSPGAMPPPNGWPRLRQASLSALRLHNNPFVKSADEDDIE